MHALDPIHLTNAATGLAFVALGLWVLSVRVRSPVNLAFATYALAWAGAVFTSNLALEVGHDASSLATFNVVLGLLLILGLAVLVLRYPRPLRHRELPTALVAVAVAALALAWDEPVRGVLRFEDNVLLAIAFGAFGVGTWAVLFFLGLRWRTLEGPHRRGVALISVALALWPAYASGDGAALSTDGARLVGALAMPVGLAGLWLWNAHAGRDRAARTVAWLVLGGALVAMLERVAFPHAPDLWGYGLSRLAGVAVLAYAIVRHQLLGIDVKVRFAISKTTIAGVFIAVFFTASEGAQILFGAGNDWVGLAAAGALVFAMAPLQRAAERLAEKAVPVGDGFHGTPRGAGADLVARNEAAYREALVLALRDRRLTREEELSLHRLADALGVRAARAHEILVEVERAEQGDG